MKTATLAVISVAALAVIGYAAWTLVADSGQTNAGRRRAHARTETEEATPPGGSTRRKGGIRRIEPTLKGDARQRPKAGPAPRPVPKVSLEKARSDFQGVIAEYDKLLEAETPLNDKSWVELYAKGAEALIPLQQHLDWSVEAEAAELSKAQASYRTRVDELQRQVVRPPTKPRP
ncbi:MAG: hypothetical protein JKY37_30750 [Nannocystaceae bacterium]|nr:hypothetical protein [Nannocystaceae bacterium]